MSYPYTCSVAQSTVIQLLLASHPALLHRDEIRRELGNCIDADDALAYFERVGLVHQLDDFFWATRTAMAAEEAATAHNSGEAAPHDPQPGERA